jgi:hypothetical protein
MADRSEFDFETPLAMAVQHYLSQEPNERISEDENLRPVCELLDGLLNRLLRSEDAWGRYRSTDGIMPCTATRVSGAELEFTGLVIWMTDRPIKSWVEPLFASVRILDSSLEGLDYKLFFGNAALGLGQRPYGSNQDFPQIPVTEWMFEFNSHLDHKKSAS